MAADKQIGPISEEKKSIKSDAMSQNGKYHKVQQRTPSHEMGISNIHHFPLKTILCKLCIQRTNEKHYIIHIGSSNNQSRAIQFSPNPINQRHLTNNANFNLSEKRIDPLTPTPTQTQSILITQKTHSLSVKTKIQTQSAYILETNFSVLSLR